MTAAELVRQLPREEHDTYEVGRLVQEFCAAGDGFLHLHFGDGEPRQSTDGEYHPVRDVVLSGMNSAGRHAACRETVLDALRTTSRESGEMRICDRCGVPRPIGWFRFKSKRSARVRGECKQCRRERDAELRKEGRRA